MRFLLAAFALALLASACGGSATTTSTGSGADTAAIETSAPGDADPTEPPVGDSAESDPDEGQATGSEGPAGDEPDDSADDDPDASAPPASVSREDAAANAAANGPDLVIAGDPNLTEVLLVADGSVTTLADAVTGDRPLLIWFWAPH